MAKGRRNCFCGKGMAITTSDGRLVADFVRGSSLIVVKSQVSTRRYTISLSTDYVMIYRGSPVSRSVLHRTRTGRVIIV